jgi:hypothetical protein
LHAATQRSDAHGVVLPLVHLVCLRPDYVKLLHLLVALEELELNGGKTPGVGHRCQLGSVLDWTLEVVFESNLTFWPAAQKRLGRRRRTCNLVLVQYSL